MVQALFLKLNIQGWMSDPIEQNLMLVSVFLTASQAAKIKCNLFFLLPPPYSTNMSILVLGNSLSAETGEVA